MVLYTQWNYLNKACSSQKDDLLNILEVNKQQAEEHKTLAKKAFVYWALQEITPAKRERKGDCCFICSQPVIDVQQHSIALQFGISWTAPPEDGFFSWTSFEARGPLWLPWVALVHCRRYGDNKVIMDTFIKLSESGLLGWDVGAVCGCSRHLCLCCRRWLQFLFTALLPCARMTIFWLPQKKCSLCKGW